MALDPQVLILRDPRESQKKCSLTPLRGMAGIEFVEYRADRVVPAHGRVLLHPDGDELTADDGRAGLLLIDCSWRRVPSLRRTLTGEPVLRRLPALATAYPRRSRLFEDPAQGLASVEALYAALFIMGSCRPELLDAYHWAHDFLGLNPGLRA